MTSLIAPAAVATVAILVTLASKAVDESRVTIMVSTTKERAELCRADACTVVSKAEIEALVAEAMKMQKKRDEDGLDSNGCVRGRT